MKQYIVKLTPRARASINEIVSDLRKAVSSAYATKVRKEILTTIKSLKTFPEAHQSFDELSDGNHEYRRALTLRYKIVFTITKMFWKLSSSRSMINGEERSGSMITCKNPARAAPARNRCPSMSG